jgi:hypothetical protein
MNGYLQDFRDRLQALMTEATASGKLSERSRLTAEEIQRRWNSRRSPYRQVSITDVLKTVDALKTKGFPIGGNVVEGYYLKQSIGEPSSTIHE